MKKIKMYNGTQTLNPNRIIKDVDAINYLFGLGVPMYMIREKSNKDNFFVIAGEEVTDKLKGYYNGRKKDIFA